MFDLNKYGITVKTIHRNTSPAELYEHAILAEKGSAIVSNGALAVTSGEKTGRSPKDKRIVKNPASENDIWWSDVNIGMDNNVFMINQERAIDYLNTKKEIFVFDGYAGWDPEYQIKVRVICSRAYHALFMRNMLIRPTDEQLAEFGEPDYVIFNSGEFPANRYTAAMTSTTSVDIDFEKKQIVILGTEYAGEMKKGIFTVMHYLMPKTGVLSMHCSANEGEDQDVSLFFGLSGTGKTTLSADPKRQLIGDDEHCWTDNGVFNIEGGCYAKCIGLTKESEPEIYDAIKFGAILENVVFDSQTREIDYADTSLTLNTRVAYPIEHIENAKIPCLGGTPKNIILLTCDAFGVLPPVSLLSPEQAMYHFISGFTSKVAGTEQGVTEPEATFSACYGAAFLVWHPSKYAELLADKVKQHKANVYLVNTGWIGGAYGVGKRISLKYTRAIIDAIHSGELLEQESVTDPLFGFKIPKQCSNVPSDVLIPKNSWKDKEEYQQQAFKLAQLFIENFKKYESNCSEEILSAAPACE